jgi:indole-3-glycerol phosphate synthase
VRGDRRPRPRALVEQALALPATRPFATALTDDPDIAVIAEVKRRSPSRGPLALDLDPASLARSYQCGGAACLSVLTDERWFGGSAADLVAAREACHLPVLRKDFTVDERDVADARLMGADAVLLIAAVLDDDLLDRCLRLAADLGMAALVEVHDAEELARATGLGATVIGVNQRDLQTFEIDRALASRLRERMPPGAVTVAESGVRGAEDAIALAAAGYDAVLVGETLVTSDDPGAAVVDLRAGR